MSKDADTSSSSQATAIPSRDAVDYDELNRLFALMPEGPWQDMRSTGGHEIRQIDIDPTNKHHWPFRLCQSITGQRAACDDAVFAFLAGVLNAWPSIYAANSDDEFIARTLAMSDDELRKRFLINGECPDQAATIAKQSFEVARFKVALIQISSQYVANRGDMTDADALEAIKKIADRALAGEARSAETHSGSVHEHAADLSATPKHSPEPNPPMSVEEAREVLNGLWKGREYAYVVRLRSWAGEISAQASRIEAALITLSENGEVRSLQIREGAYYRSAAGERIGPMHRIKGDASQVWYARGQKGDWLPNGHALHSTERDNLVAEWAHVQEAAR